MNSREFDGLVADGVDAVLETMFFTEPLPPSEPRIDETVLEARVGFKGEPSGSLDVRISKASARSLVAAFLGEDEEALDDAQNGQIVCELANMLCGWVLSHVECDRHFDLNPPELLCSETEKRIGSPPASEQSFAIENGFLTVALYLDTPHEP